MKFWTAQYRYSGDDRIDITAKSEDKIGKLFAPTIQLVFNYKDGYITQDEYIEQYMDLLTKSFKNHKLIWEKFLDMNITVVFVCYCKADTFCHRLLLAKVLDNMGATYLGELKNLKQEKK
jgi:uncharacterized protein YeaO (DUF488 family)